MRHVAMAAGLGLGLLSGTVNAAPITFDYTGEFVTQKITQSGIYSIFAYGAQGGTSTFVDGTNAGGLGAEIGGQFSLMKGDVLTIAVGEAGTSNFGFGSGGGGGTFIVLNSPSNPLLIAGGGGGAGSGFVDGGPGQASQTGQTGGDSGGQGGTSGSGGSRGGLLGGGGGGGFLTDGGSGIMLPIGNGGGGGKSYANGLTGGSAGDGGVSGGFGGGGGSAALSGGGGGGYSGGGGAGSANGGYGGGGGSFLDEALLVTGTEVALTGENTGDGFASLELVSPTVGTVPLPASAPMFGAALLALGAFGYGLKRKKAAAVA
jgi:hypothetical protein